MKTREIFEIVGVSSIKQLEDEVHKKENLGLDKNTVEVLIDRISRHTYQNVSAKSLRRIRLFDCSILELPHAQAEKILTCLVPREKLDEKIVRTFVAWVLTNNRRLNLEHSLRPAIRWINCVIRHSLCSISSLQFAYEPFFQLLGIGTVRPFVLDILFNLTANKKELVTQCRVKFLIKLMKKDTSVQVLSLLTRFRDLRPDLVPDELPKRGTAIKRTHFRMEKTFAAKWNEAETEIESDGNNVNNYVNKISDFIRDLTKLKTVTQAISLINKPPQAMLYLALSSTEMQERLSFTLYYTLYNEFFSMTQSAKHRKRKTDLLCRVNRLQEYFQHGLPVVGRFLAQYLSTWDGDEYFIEICKMLSCLQLTEMQELEECILQPIRTLFNSKLSCIHQLLILNYLGRLAQHWAVMEYERFKNCLSGPFPMTNANMEEGPLDSIFGLSEAITQMAETGFCQLVSKDENSDRHRLHVNTYIQETLSIFRTITRCFIEGNIPIRSKLPESIIYFSLFGRNPVFISESLEYLTMIKHETIPVIMKIANKLDENDDILGHETASRQLEELNDLNVLVKDSLAILSTDKHLLVRGESIFRKEWSLDDDLIRQELSINNHLVFLPYVIKFITEENVDLETLSDTYSDAFKDYFKMLKSHLPRVTEFIDTFQLKVVENDCEETQNSSQLDASQESESGIESMTSTRR